MGMSAGLGLSYGRCFPSSLLLWSVKCSICVLLVVQQTQNIECVPMAGGNYSECVSVSVSDLGTDAREFTGTLSDVRLSSLLLSPPCGCFPVQMGDPGFSWS